MAATRGKRVAGKKKPKSIKAKVTSKMSSKRRLSRMGKEMKKVSQSGMGLDGLMELDLDPIGMMARSRVC